MASVGVPSSAVGGTRPGSGVSPAVERRVVDPEPAPCEAVRGLQVLVVGVNYWPEPTGIAPYTTGMAEHLARSAAGVTVLAGVPHYPTWRLPAEFRGRLRTCADVRGVQVHRLRHYVPSRQSALTRAGYEATFLAQAVAVRVPRPDVVIAVTPSLAGVVAGRVLARRHSAPLVAVVQDLMGRAAGQSGIAGGCAVAGLTGRLEAAALGGAGIVAVVCEDFRPALEEHGLPPERVALLPNWSHVPECRRDRMDVRRELGWPADQLVALHTGNMGLKQDLGNVVEAARLAAGRTDLRFVLVGDGSQRSALEHQATGLPNLHIAPPVSDEDYPHLLAAADVLLVNERPSVSDMSLPSKLTSYYRSGRPVLGAVTAAGATARQLRESGAGVRVDPADPRALLDGLVALAAQPERRRELGISGRRYAAAHLSKAASMAALDELLATAGARRLNDRTAGR